MSTVQVRALMRFEHNTTRNEGDVFRVSDKHAEQLVAKGLCELSAAPSVGESSAKNAPKQQTARSSPTQNKREQKTDKAPAHAAAVTDTAAAADGAAAEGSASE